MGRGYPLSNIPLPPNQKIWNACPIFVLTAIELGGLHVHVIVTLFSTLMEWSRGLALLLHVATVFLDNRVSRRRGRGWCSCWGSSVSYWSLSCSTTRTTTTWPLTSVKRPNNFKYIDAESAHISWKLRGFSSVSFCLALETWIRPEAARSSWTGDFSWTSAQPLEVWITCRTYPSNHPFLIHTT